MRSRQLYLSRAIRAADWFVNHITRQAPPVSDANRGRVLYNYHMPSKTACPGIETRATMDATLTMLPSIVPRKIAMAIAMRTYHLRE